MTVRDLIKEDIDIDVCDDYDESCWIAYCGPARLTEEGVQEFHEVLDINVHMVNPGFGGLPVCILECDGDDDEVAERKVKACKRFFFSFAGYCTVEEWDRWFEED